VCCGRREQVDVTSAGPVPSRTPGRDLWAWSDAVDLLTGELPCSVMGTGPARVLEELASFRGPDIAVFGHLAHRVASYAFGVAFRRHEIPAVVDVGVNARVEPAERVRAEPEIAGRLVRLSDLVNRCEVPAYVGNRDRPAVHVGVIGFHSCPCFVLVACNDSRSVDLRVTGQRVADLEGSHGSVLLVGYRNVGFDVFRP